MEWIGQVASLVTSLTIVGGALMWVYEKLIGAPRAKQRAHQEAVEAQLLDSAIKESVIPLQEAIEQLTAWLKESEEDRINLRKMQDVTTQQIGEIKSDVQRHEIDINVIKEQLRK